MAGRGRIEAMPRQRPAIRHAAVPGRLRLFDGRLRAAPDAARLAQLALRGVPGVHAATASAVTGTALVHFTRPATRAGLIRALGAALGDPPPSRPLSAAATEAEDGEGTAAAPHLWHAMAPGRVASLLETDPVRGLSAEAAAARLALYGPNLLAEAELRSVIAILAEQLVSAPVALLGASAAVSLATGGLADAAAIAAVLALNAGIATVTERRAEHTIRSLAQPPREPVPVVRAGRRTAVPPEAVVPGDVILVEPGTLVAADSRLLEARELSVNEAALTGESLPVQKDPAPTTPEAPLAERRGMLFRGTAVSGGTGRAVVVATGAATEIGRIQTLLGSIRPPETPIERQLGEVGRDLVLINGVIAAAILGLGLMRGRPWPELLRSATSLAVAAVPEGLPAVATSTLAVGIEAMRRQGILVRRLDAVETLGAVGTVCLDKTGTLTVNRMRVVSAHLDGRAAAPGEHPLAARLFEAATLCSDVAGDGAGRLRGSPTELALVEAGIEAGLDPARLGAAWPRVAVAMRAEGRKRMATLHRAADGAERLAVKGDPVEVLARATHVLTAAGPRPLEAAARQAIQAANDRMAGQALRVLAVAEAAAGDPHDEQGLTWLGLVGLADPVRPGAASAIARLHRAGIRTVMITGDQSATAHAVARALGLARGQDVRVLEAGAIRDVAPELLAALAPQADVFARVSPSNKLAIVEALRRSGQVVAMTGDGINDGPALRAAEIGIAMGAEGSDVAREVADIVLATDDLAGMLDAIRLGRATYANIRKVLRYLVGTNASETMVMLGAALAGVAPPLTPMQLLWLNLVSDPLPALALGLEPPEADVLAEAPRDPLAPILGGADFRRLLREGGVIGAATLVAALAGPPGAAFHGLTLAQLAHAFVCRSETHDPFSPALPKPGLALLGAVGAGIGLQVAAQAVPGLRQVLGLPPFAAGSLATIALTALVPLAINAALSARRGEGGVP